MYQNDRKKMIFLSWSELQSEFLKNVYLLYYKYKGINEKIKYLKDKI